MSDYDLNKFAAEIDKYAAMSRPLLNSVLVLRAGGLITEHYWRGFTARSYQHIFSVTKSVVSALIGLALADGKLTLADTLAQWFPEAQFPPGSHAISVTVQHLLTMTAGFERTGRQGAAHNPLDALLKRGTATLPGEKFNYINDDVDLLLALLERAVGESAVEYAHRRLFTPLGIWNSIPRSGYKRLWKTDKHGHSRGSHGLHLTTPELALFGQLYLQRGWWQNQQLLPADYVAASTLAQVSGGYPENVRYGYLWWIFTDYAGNSAFFASGAGGQYICVLPAFDLVIAITATSQKKDARHHRVMITRLVTDLIASHDSVA